MYWFDKRGLLKWFINRDLVDTLKQRKDKLTPSDCWGFTISDFSFLLKSVRKVQKMLGTELPLRELNI